MRGVRRHSGSPVCSVAVTENLKRTRSTAQDDLTTLITWLADHDEQCPICSYNLRGLAQDRCPECNAQLTLTVWSEQMRVGPWVLGVVSFSLGAGFDGVMSFLLGGGLIIAPPQRAALWGVPLAILASLITLCGVCMIGIGWFVIRRRAWARLPIRRQWQYAWMIFAVVATGHAAFGGLLVLMVT